MLVINKVNLKIPQWHKEHEDFKIVVLADVHAGSPFIDDSKLEKIVELVNKQKPDLILLLGDDVIHGVKGGKFIEPQITAAYYSKLKSKYGIISVLGNHDWWYNGKKVRKALINNNIDVLENDYRIISHNNKSFIVAGLADLDTQNPPVKEFINSITTSNPVILLSHNPDIFPEVTEKISLTLAGHTHGGQVIIPFYGSKVVPSKYGNRYARGHIVEEGKHLFVSSGIGTSILPIRFNCPPEIVVLTLESN
ncbi:MAG: metallophosphoesterase [Cyanobacteriota bacterium]